MLANAIHVTYIECNVSSGMNTQQIYNRPSGKHSKYVINPHDFIERKESSIKK